MASNELSTSMSRKSFYEHEESVKSNQMASKKLSNSSDGKVRNELDDKMVDGHLEMSISSLFFCNEIAHFFSIFYFLFFYFAKRAENRAIELFAIFFFMLFLLIFIHFFSSQSRVFRVSEGRKKAKRPHIDTFWLL